MHKEKYYLILKKKNELLSYVEKKMQVEDSTSIDITHIKMCPAYFIIFYIWTLRDRNMM